jgi:hypothetical protein
MRHWHSGLPPEPYRWVLRWQMAQGPALSPGQTSTDGPGSVIGGGGVAMAVVPFQAMCKSPV